MRPYLAWDHRDGAPAGQSLATVREYLEAPLPLGSFDPLAALGMHCILGLAF